MRIGTVSSPLLVRSAWRTVSEDPYWNVVGPSCRLQMQQTMTRVSCSFRDHNFRVGRSLDRYDAGKAWLSARATSDSQWVTRERRLEGPVSFAPDRSLGLSRPHLVIRYGIESLGVGFGFLLIVRTERIFTVHVAAGTSNGL